VAPPQTPLGELTTLPRPPGGLLCVRGRVWAREEEGKGRGSGGEGKGRPPSYC